MSAALAAGLSLIPIAAHPPGDHHLPPRITVVLSRDIPPYRLALTGLRKAFESARPVPTLEVVDLDSGADPGGAIAVSESGRDSELLVAVGARAALALHSRADSLPILLAGASGPEIESLLRKGAGRVFGVGLQIPFDDQFRTLTSALPDARRIGVLHGPENRGEIRLARAAAERQGLTLEATEVVSVRDIPEALSRLLGQVDVLWAVPDTTVFSPEMSSHIILQTLREHVPFMSFSQNFVRAGALLGLYCDLHDVGMQAGEMALGAIRGGGHPPAGVVPPRTVRLAINLRVASVIGVRIPDSVRDRADAIYE